MKVKDDIKNYDLEKKRPKKKFLEKSNGLC